MGIFSALRPLVAGAKIALENPRVKQEAALAARYASSRLEGQGERALLKAGQFLGSGGRRLARVYESPAGQLAVNAAFIAPMFMPMGGGEGETATSNSPQGFATDYTSGLQYQSMPLQPVDNYDQFSAGYIHQPSIAPDIVEPSHVASQALDSILNPPDIGSLRAKYQQMGASPFSY